MKKRNIGRMLPIALILLSQTFFFFLLANFSSKGPHGKYLGFAGYAVSVTTTHLCHWHAKAVADAHKCMSMAVFQ